MDKKNIKKYVIFIAMVLTMAAVAYLIIGCFLAELFQDGHTRWQESAYVLKGINPLDIITRKLDIIPEIGKIYKTAASTPWTYVLNNLFVPGFLPWALAKPIAVCICLFVQLLACVSIYKYFSKKITVEYKKYIIWLAIAAFLASYAILSGLKWGNNALVVSALLMIVICIDKDKHPIFTGICLGLSMIKPQMAFLFFIPFLVNKSYKIYITGTVVVLSAWITASILANANPLEMLMQNYGQGSGLHETSRYVYFGLFDLLILKGIPVSYVLLPQMLIFTGLTFFLSYKYRNIEQVSLFSIPAVFSSMWMYSHAFDLQIVNTVIIATIVFMFSEKEISRRVFFSGCLIILSVLAPIPQQLHEISFVIPLLQRIVFLIALVYVLSIDKLSIKKFKV